MLFSMNATAKLFDTQLAKISLLAPLDLSSQSPNISMLPKSSFKRLEAAHVERLHGMIYM